MRLLPPQPESHFLTFPISLCRFAPQNCATSLPLPPNSSSVFSLATISTTEATALCRCLRREAKLLHWSLTAAALFPPDLQCAIVGCQRSPRCRPIQRQPLRLYRRVCAHRRQHVGLQQLREQQHGGLRGIKLDNDINAEWSCPPAISLCVCIWRRRSRRRRRRRRSSSRRRAIRVQLGVHYEIHKPPRDTSEQERLIPGHAIWAYPPRSARRIERGLHQLHVEHPQGSGLCLG